MTEKSDAIANQDVPRMLGMRLHRAREQAALSIEMAAQKTQISPQRLCDIEAGDTLVDSAELLRLCACYEANAERLFEGIEGVAPLSIDDQAVFHLIQGMLKDDSPSRGRSFRGLISLLRGQK